MNKMGFNWRLLTFHLKPRFGFTIFEQKKREASASLFLNSLQFFQLFFCTVLLITIQSPLIKGLGFQIMLAIFQGSLLHVQSGTDQFFDPTAVVIENCKFSGM